MHLAQTTGAAPGTAIASGGYGACNLGDHVGDVPEGVAVRREGLRARLGVSAIGWLEQVHGTAVQEVREPLPPTVATADAQWTRTPSVALAIMTADCLPILAWSLEDRWVAAIHGGWRGLVGGVITATLRSLAEAGSNVHSPWQAWLGPAISAPCYEVDAPVHDAVQQRLQRHLPRASMKAVLLPGRAPDRWQLDLVALARAELGVLGCAAVWGGTECTASQPHYYSYRQANRVGPQPCGRQASLVWRAPEG